MNPGSKTDRTVKTILRFLIKMLWMLVVYLQEKAQNIPPYMKKHDLG